MGTTLFDGEVVDIDFTLDADDHGVAHADVLHVLAAVLWQDVVGSQGDESRYWLGTDRAGIHHVEVQATFVQCGAERRRLRIYHARVIKIRGR